MKKSIVFDTGPIITLAMNNLLWVLKELKKDFNGDFLIPGAVKNELIDRPLKSKKFKFEALQVLSYMNKGVIKVVESSDIRAKADSLLDIANKVFRARGNYIQLVHYGEIEAVALALIAGAPAFVVDERTTRMLIENPLRLRKIMERKLHTKITIDEKNLKEFRKMTKSIKPIRSTELVVIAYEKGLLNKFFPKKMADPKRELLDGLLWAVKLNGCSVSEKEIKRILKIETRRRL